MVDLVLKVITETIERGETVKLSSFGTFMVRKKGQRIGRNPNTGVAVPIVPRRVAIFKASAIMKQEIQSKPKPALPDETPAPDFRAMSAEPVS
jgi:integration host factor subunit alpha